MPCEPFRSADGTVTGILCTRRGKRAKCGSCGAPCDYECDFPTDKKSQTCDAKICAACSLHIVGRQMSIGGGLYKPDSYDFCKTHQPFVFHHEGKLIYVANSRNLKDGELVDRTTPLGNPYKLEGEDTPTARAAVIEQYRQHLWRELQNPASAASQDLSKLREIWLENGSLILRCWCTPRACHGQVIARALIWQVTTQQQTTAA